MTQKLKKKRAVRDPQFVSTVAILAFQTAFPSAIFAAEPCATRPNRMQATLLVTPRAQEKIIRAGFTSLTSGMDALLRNVPPTVTIGSNRETCAMRRDENGRAVPPPGGLEQVNHNCIGFLPTNLWPMLANDPRNPASRELSRTERDRLSTPWNGYMEPLSIDLQNFSISNLNFQNEPAISCTQGTCTMTATIRSLNVGFNANLRSVNENCTTARIPNVRIGLRDNGPPVTATIHFRFTGDVNNPVQMIQETSGFDLPAERIVSSMGAAQYGTIVPNHSQLAQLAPATAANSTARTSPGSSRAPAPAQRTARRTATPPAQSAARPNAPVTPTQTTEFCNKPDAQELLQSLPGVINGLVLQRQWTLDRIMNAIRDKVLIAGLQRDLPPILRAGGVGAERGVTAAIPSIRDVTDARALQATADAHLRLANEYLAAVREAKTPEELQRVSLSQNGFSDKVKEFVRNFADADTHAGVRLSDSVAGSWSEVSQTLMSQRRAIQAVRPPDMSVSDQQNMIQRLQEQIALIDQGVAQITSLKRRLQLRFQDTREPIDFLVAATRANDLTGNIEMLLNACFRCRSYNFTDAPRFGSDVAGNTFDLKLETGLPSINQVLTYMNEMGNLDICLVSGAPHTCDGRTTGDNSFKAHAGSIRLGVEPDGSISINLENVGIETRDNRFLSVATLAGTDLRVQRIKLVGSIQPSADGTQFTFKPEGSRTRIEGANFSGSALSTFTQGLINTFANSRTIQAEIKHALTQTVEIPQGATIQRIQTSQTGGIAIYMNLPEATQMSRLLASQNQSAQPPVTTP